MFYSLTKMKKLSQVIALTFAFNSISYSAIPLYSVHAEETTESESTATDQATTATTSSTPKYMSNITYSTGNANIETINANQLMNSLALIANGESDAGREYTQEEKDLAAVTVYNEMGLNKKTVQELKDKIAAKKEAGEELGSALSTMEKLIEEYDAVAERVTNGDSILAENQPTVQQLAILRTALKTEQIKSDTECKNKRAEDPEATCELSDAGKQYASILSYLQGQQINQTTQSTKTTTATDTGTGNTNVTVKNGTVASTNNSTSASNTNSSSATQATNATGSVYLNSSGQQVTCGTDGVYISSANKCCPASQPNYNDGKCYSTSNSSSSSSSDSDKDSGLDMATLMMLLNQNKSTEEIIREKTSNGGFCPGCKGNTSAKTGTATTEKGEKTVEEATGSKISVKVGPYERNKIPRLGVAEEIIVNFEASKNLKLPNDANGKQITPKVILHVPTYVDTGNGIKFVYHTITGNLGEKIEWLPDSNKGYTISEVQGKAYREVNKKDINGKTIPWTLGIEIINPKSEERIGSMTYDYIIGDYGVVLTNSDESKWDVETVEVDATKDPLEQLSFSFSGEIGDTSYDDASGMCVINVSGTAISNYSSTSYNTEAPIATNKIDKANCEKLSGSGEKVAFDDLHALKTANGDEAEYFTDTGSIRIGETSESTLKYLPDMSVTRTSYITGDGWEFPVEMTNVNGKWEILELANKENNSLCKNSDGCKQYLNEKLGYDISELTFKDEDKDGVSYINPYKSDGTYVGMNKVDGFTAPKESSDIMSYKHYDYIENRISNGYDAVGASEVEAMDYVLNPNRIAIKNIGDNEYLNTESKGQANSPVASVAKAAKNTVEKAVNGVASLGKAITNSDIGIEVAKSTTYNTDSWTTKYSLDNMIKSTRAYVKDDAKDKKEASKTVNDINKTIQVVETVTEMSAGILPEIDKLF